MDINALVSRDKAYFNNLVTQGTLTVFLSESNLNLIATATVVASDTGSLVTITAPFNPQSSTRVSLLQVLEKSPSDPTEYASVWTSVDTTTLSPSPTSVQIGDLFTIGTNTYQVMAKVGSSVTFSTPVSEVAVFYANVASPDVTYQWQLSEDNGVTWVDIVGATERSYEPLAGDVGDNLRVIISYVDGQGTIEQPTLAPPETQPSVIYPVYPIIADIELDVVRTYAPNLVTELMVQITST
jgi:hypothetical protein